MCKSTTDTSTMEYQCDKGKPPVDSLVIDVFHYHEIADRCHIINSMIDDFILAHPACSVLMSSYAVNAQSLICAVMNEAAKEEDKLS